MSSVEQPVRRACSRLRPPTLGSFEGRYIRHAFCIARCRVYRGFSSAGPRSPTRRSINRDRRRHPIAPPVSAHTVFGPRLRVQSTTVRQGCQISSDEIREIFVHQFIHARSTQPCIPPGSLNRVPASAGVRAGMSPPPDGR